MGNETSYSKRRRLKKKPVTYEAQVREHKRWHKEPRDGRASDNHTPSGDAEFLDVDDDTGRCNMCGQEFTGRSKKQKQ